MTPSRNPGNPNRRTVLKTLGVGLGGLAATGRVGAREPRRLGVLSELPVDGIAEAVSSGNYTYGAVNAEYADAADSALVVVDDRNPRRPEVVARRPLADDLERDPSIDEVGPLHTKDAKVDGDVAALANDTEAPGGIALYDVSDPTAPSYESFYAPEPPSNIHNVHLADGFAYLALGEPENTDTDGDGDRDLVRIFGDAGVEVVDVRDPANPTHAATWLLKDELPDYAKAGVNPCHDLYTQDDVCWAAFWDAGTVALDVSDPTDPTFLAQFGAAPKGDEVIRPWRVEEESVGEYFNEVFPFGRYLAPPGNAHYVQPTPDGSHVLVGAETFLGSPGGIDVYEVVDLAAGEVTQVGRIDPPDVDGFRTSHNFDFQGDRLYTSWYAGGVRVFDLEDPANPRELSNYRAEGSLFWTAVGDEGYVVGSAYGDGLVYLGANGEKREDDLGDSGPPSSPEPSQGAQ